MTKDPSTKEYWDKVSDVLDELQLEEDNELVETGITSSGAALHITADLDGNSITFERDKTAKEWLTDHRKTADGRTVGQMNRDFLHRRLDEWINQLAN